MKPLKHLSFMLLAAALLSFSAAYADDDVVVIIDGKAVNSATFEQYVVMRTQQAQHNGKINNEQRKLLLQEYINSELLYNAAIKAGIDKSPAVKAEIEMQTRSAIINHGLKNHLDEKLTEAALKAAYDEAYGEGSHEYHIRHILVKSEPETNNILAALKRGEDFKKLAGTLSIDPSSSDGGDLGWLDTDVMPPPFAAIISKLKPGEYSQMPVQTRFGWHVIQLDEKRATNPPPFETVAEQLAIALQNKVIKDYLENLRNNAAIEIK